MNRRKRRLTASLVMCIAALALGATGALSSGCELLVQLDRSLADAGTEDVVLGVCPICGDEAGEDAATDAPAEGATDSGAGSDADAEGAHDAEAGPG